MKSSFENSNLIKASIVNVYKVITLCVFIVLKFSGNLLAQTNELNEWTELLNPDKLQLGVIEYQMLNSDGEKIGSMIFDRKIEDEFLVFRDTSELNNRTIYETATYKINLNTLKSEKINIKFKNGPSNFDLEHKLVDENFVTKISSFKNGEQKETDSELLYDSFDLVRSEIFALIETNTLALKKELELDLFIELSGKIVKASLLNMGSREIEVYGIKYDVIEYKLSAPSEIPTNIIYVSKKLKKIIKVDVVEAEMEVLINPGYLLNTKN